MVERINFRVAVRGAAQTATNFNTIAAAVQSVNASVAATAQSFARNSSTQAAASGASTVQIVNNYKTIQKTAVQAAAAEEALARRREKDLFLTNQSLGRFLDKQRAQREKEQARRIAAEEVTAKREQSIQAKAAATAASQAAARAKAIERVEAQSQAKRLASTVAFLGRLQSLSTTVGSATVRALASIGTIGPSLRRSLGAIEAQLNQFGNAAGKSFVGKLISAVTSGFAVIPKLIGQLVGPITSSIGIIVKAAGASFTALGSTIGATLGAALGTINPILGGIVSVATASVGSIIGTFVAGSGAIIQVFGGVLEGVTGVFSGLVAAAGGAVAKVADLLSSIANRVFSTVGALVENTVGQVVGAIGGLFGTLGGIVESGLRTIFSPIGLIIGGLSIKAAADIRDKVVNTFALLDDRTQASVDAVTNRLSDLATRVGVPVAQIGDLFFNVVSAGFRELGGAIEILERAAELAVAGSARVQDTGKNLITLLAATKAPAEAAGKAAQFFFDVQDRGVITIQELSTSFPDLVSAIIAAKLPLEEVGALFSVLTREGQSAAETATQLQQVILNLVAPIPQARRKMQALGLEIHELSETDRAVIEGLENQIVALENRNTLLEGGSAAARDNADALAKLNAQLAAQIEVRGKFVGVTEALSRIKQLLVELDAEDTKVSRSIVSRIRAVKGLTFLADNIDRIRKETSRVGQSPEKFIAAIDLANQKIGVQVQKTIGELRQLGIAIFRLGSTVTGGSGFETVRQAIRGLRDLIEGVVPAVARVRSGLLSFKDTLVAAFSPITSLGVAGLFDKIGDAFDKTIERIGSTNLGEAIVGALEGFVSGVSRIISGARVSTIFESIRDGAQRAQREVSNLRGGKVDVEIDSQGAEEAERKISKIAQSLEEKIGAAANSAGSKIDELFASNRVGVGLDEGLGKVQSTFSSVLIPGFKAFQEEANEILRGIGVDPIEFQLPDLETLSLSTQGVDEARESFQNLEIDAKRAVRSALREIEDLTDPRATDIKVGTTGLAAAEQGVRSLAQTITTSIGDASSSATSDLALLAAEGAKVGTVFESIRRSAQRAQGDVSNLSGSDVEVNISTRGADEAQRKIVKIADALESKVGAAANSAGLKIDELFASNRVGAGLDEGLGRVQSAFARVLIPNFKKFQEEANEILSAIGVDPIEIDLPDLDTISLSTQGVDEARESFRNLEADARRAIRTAVTEVARLSTTRDTTIQIRAEGVEGVEREILSLAKTISGSLGEASDEAAADLSRLAVKVKVGGFDSGVLKDISVGVKSFIDRSSGDLIDFQNFANAELAKIGADPIDFDFSALKVARTDLEKGLKLGTIDTGALELPGKILDQMVKDLRDAGLGIGDIEPKVTRLVRGVIGEFRNLSKVLAGEMALSKTVTGATYSFIEARIKLAIDRAKLAWASLTNTVRQVSGSFVGLVARGVDASVDAISHGVRSTAQLISKFLASIGGLLTARGLLHSLIFGGLNAASLVNQARQVLDDFSLSVSSEISGLRSRIATSLTDIQVQINPSIDFERTALFSFSQNLQSAIDDAVGQRALIQPKIELKREEIDSLQTQVGSLVNRIGGAGIFGPVGVFTTSGDSGLESATKELRLMEEEAANLDKIIVKGTATFERMAAASEKVRSGISASIDIEDAHNSLLEIGEAIQARITRQRLEDLQVALDQALVSGKQVEADKIQLAIANEVARVQQEATVRVADQLDQISRFPSRIRSVLEALTEADEDQQNAVIAVLRAQKDLLKSEEDSATVAEERVRLAEELLAITQQIGLTTADTAKLLDKVASPFNQGVPQVEKPESQAKQPPPSAPPPLDTSTLDAINASLRGEFSDQNVTLEAGNQSSNLIRERLDSPFNVIVDQAFARRIQEILSERGVTPGVGGFVGDQQIARGEGIIPLKGGFPLDLIRDIFEQTTIGIENVGLSAEVLLKAVKGLQAQAQGFDAPGRFVGQSEGFQISGGQVTGISPNAAQSDIGQTILKSLAGKEAVLDLLDSQGLQLRHLGLLENRLQELVGLQKQQLAADAAFDRDFGKGAGGTGAGTSTLQGVRRKDVDFLTGAVKDLNTINDKLLDAQKFAEKAAGAVTAAEQSGASQNEILAFDEKLQAANQAVVELQKQSAAAGASLQIVTQGSKAFTGLVEEFSSLGKINLDFLNELSQADLKAFGKKGSGAIADADLRQLFKDAAGGNEEALDTIAKAQEAAKKQLEGGGGGASASSTEQIKLLGEAAAKAAAELNKIATGEDGAIEGPDLGPGVPDIRKKPGEPDVFKQPIPPEGVDKLLAKGDEIVAANLADKDTVPPTPPAPVEPPKPVTPETPGSGFTKPQPKDDKLDTKKVQSALKEQIEAVKQALEEQLQEVLESQKEVSEATKEAITKQAEMVNKLTESLEAIADAEERVSEKFKEATSGFEELGDGFQEFAESTTQVLEEHERQIKENAIAIKALDVRLAAIGG